MSPSLSHLMVRLIRVNRDSVLAVSVAELLFFHRLITRLAFVLTSGDRRQSLAD